MKLDQKKRLEDLRLIQIKLRLLNLRRKKNQRKKKNQRRKEEPKKKKERKKKFFDGYTISERYDAFRKLIEENKTQLKNMKIKKTLKTREGKKTFDNEYDYRKQVLRNTIGKPSNLKDYIDLGKLLGLEIEVKKK